MREVGGRLISLVRLAVGHLDVVVDIRHRIALVGASVPDHAVDRDRVRAEGATEQRECAGSEAGGNGRVEGDGGCTETTRETGAVQSTNRSGVGVNLPSADALDGG